MHSILSSFCRQCVLSLSVAEPWEPPQSLRVTVPHCYGGKDIPEVSATLVPVLASVFPTPLLVSSQVALSSATERC